MNVNRDKAKAKPKQHERRDGVTHVSPQHMIQISAERRIQ